MKKGNKLLLNNYKVSEAHDQNAEKFVDSELIDNQRFETSQIVGD